MTYSQSMAYRLVPKCACSTIGQIMFFSDHGHFFDGDIHDAAEGLYKWSDADNRYKIVEAVRGRRIYVFSAVRNPYERILSCFFDKILSTQRDGGKYRANLVDQIDQRYGLGIGAAGNLCDIDQIKAFRLFLLFARDTIMWGHPMPADIHWMPITDHVASLIKNGGRYDCIFHVESFFDGMEKVLDALNTPHRVVLSDVPRFNKTAHQGIKMMHRVADYFDDMAMHFMKEAYQQDFMLFNYDIDNPSNKNPFAPVDLDALHARFAPHQ